MKFESAATLTANRVPLTLVENLSCCLVFMRVSLDNSTSPI